MGNQIVLRITLADVPITVLADPEGLARKLDRNAALLHR